MADACQSSQTAASHDACRTHETVMIPASTLCPFVISYRNISRPFSRQIHGTKEEWTEIISACAYL